ncbi:MAG TPA: PQQ-binding-like beta-propeller repeat protein [Solirubrobacterales bacterium]|nr:PQQ-binding-like beta-propeller repeat protein [Solirubrobacterales bacterium]
MADETTENGAGASPTRWWHDRRKLAAAIAAAVVVVGVGVAIAYNALKRPDDVDRGTELAFEDEKERPPVAKTTNWPMFGFDRARTRFLPANEVKPPYERLWKYGDNPLLEFPPIFVRTPRRFCKPVKGPGTGCDRLFFVDNNGRAFALDADTGKKVWERDIAELNASSPAYSRGRLFIVNLEPGQIISLDAKSGKTIWKRSLPGRSESSPVVVGNKVFFGCECGELLALDAKNGKTKWSTQLGGEIKAAPAYRHGTLYVGDYSGTMSAVKARNGEIRWQSDGLGLSFGRAGGFYSTPAVAFGRVYNGNKDSRVYSFDAETGEVAWTYSTGSYVYSGGAVADTENTSPTVYIGSYDGNVYALDARTGDLRWSQSVGGPVMGSLTVVGNVVYAATFEGTNTSGFKLKGGKKVFSFHTGAYTPAISDGRRLYLNGYSSIHALEPVSPREAKAAKRKRQQGRQRAKKG